LDDFQEDAVIAIEALTTGDSRKLTYRREGRGRALVCQPGGPGYSSRYFSDLASLGDSCSLVIVNPRGTDASEHPSDHRSYSLADYSADLEELRAHLGLERIDLFGHSHGGMVAIVYAATHPERVDHLILSNTIAQQPSDELTRWEQQVLNAKRGEPWYDDARTAWAALDSGEFADAAELAELLLREQPLHFARYGSAERAYLETLASEMPDRAVVLLRRGIGMSFDLRPELARIQAKTLVITGDQDTNGPPAAKEIVQAIRGARLVIIPHCGHFAFVEAPERFRAEVLAFLASG
jgi:pimeloyl-ACP methyl ester carboxylesterase